MTSFDFQQFLHFGPNSPTPSVHVQWILELIFFFNFPHFKNVSILRPLGHWTMGEWTSRVFLASQGEPMPLVWLSIISTWEKIQIHFWKLHFWKIHFCKLYSTKPTLMSITGGNCQLCGFPESPLEKPQHCTYPLHLLSKIYLKTSEGYGIGNGECFWLETLIAKGDCVNY